MPRSRSAVRTKQGCVRRQALGCFFSVVLLCMAQLTAWHTFQNWLGRPARGNRQRPWSHGTSKKEAKAISLPQGYDSRQVYQENTGDLWAQAAGFCREKSRTLCTYHQLCLQGRVVGMLNNTAEDTLKKPPEWQFSPFKDAGCADNCWIQAAQGSPFECVTHDEDWGKAYFNREPPNKRNKEGVEMWENLGRVLCCEVTRSTVPRYGGVSDGPVFQQESIGLLVGKRVVPRVVADVDQEPFGPCRLARHLSNEYATKLTMLSNALNTAPGRPAWWITQGHQYAARRFGSPYMAMGTTFGDSLVDDDFDMQLLAENTSHWKAVYTHVTRTLAPTKALFPGDGGTFGVPRLNIWGLIGRKDVMNVQSHKSGPQAKSGFVVTKTERNTYASITPIFRFNETHYKTMCWHSKIWCKERGAQFSRGSWHTDIHRPVRNLATIFPLERARYGELEFPAPGMPPRDEEEQQKECFGPNASAYPDWMFLQFGIQSYDEIASVFANLKTCAEGLHRRGYASYYKCWAQQGVDELIKTVAAATFERNS